MAEKGSAEAREMARKGGLARAANLTAGRKREIAAHAARVRWARRRGERAEHPAGLLAAVLDEERGF